MREVNSALSSTKTIEVEKIDNLQETSKLGYLTTRPNLFIVVCHNKVNR